jgi:aspartyl-tRNA(Asn)/glutamyl-tRNA(Gln) amidotransferase subunit A
LDGELSSFVAIDADRARRAAEAAAEEELKNGRWRGHLHDVPIAVKELFNVGNLTATYGSQARAGVVAAADSEVVRRLRRAGAVIVGLTRSHEFGWGITTQHPSGTGTRNPWNPGFISGGSSGGSAVGSGSFRPLWPATPERRSARVLSPPGKHLACYRTECPARRIARGRRPGCPAGWGTGSLQLR